MNIALFGGSFDPPHTGHRAIVRRLARRSSIDRIWVLPAFRHPFEKKMAPFPLRLKLCRLAFGDLGKKVQIKDVERQLGGKSWTVETVRYLCRRYPHHDFFWVVGADASRTRRSWKSIEEIERYVDFIVFDRGRGSSIPNISSTILRRALARGRIPRRGLPHKVADFLLKNTYPFDFIK